MALKDYAIPDARPLPVILMLDVSGSMGVEGKIQSLNSAVKEMISNFKEQDDSQAEIHVGIITFGGAAKFHQEILPASETTWTDLSADGGTPMGASFDLARELIEDVTKISGRAYRPTMVLISDGMPTDNWQGPLTSLLNSERASKAFRFAMGIGTTDDVVLTQFLNDPENRVFNADEADQIKKFFRFITMSVTSRIQSKSPDEPEMIKPDTEVFF
jgi:uncharacterized protein YegL